MSICTRACAHTSQTVSVRGLAAFRASRLAVAGLAAFLVVGMPGAASAQGGPSEQGQANGVANGRECNSGGAGPNSGQGHGNTGMPDDCNPGTTPPADDVVVDDDVVVVDEDDAVLDDDDDVVVVVDDDTVVDDDDDVVVVVDDDTVVDDDDDVVVVVDDDTVVDDDDDVVVVDDDTVVDDDDDVAVVVDDDTVVDDAGSAGDDSPLTPGGEVLGDETESESEVTVDQPAVVTPVVLPGLVPDSPLVKPVKSAPGRDQADDEILGDGAVNRPAPVVTPAVLALPSTGAGDDLGMLTGLGASLVLAGALSLARAGRRRSFPA